MPAVLDLWRRTSALPMGDRIFSFAFSQTAPYFASVRPLFTVVEPHRAESTIPRHLRWIPRGMEVAYTAKADSDVTCIAETDPEQWTADVGEGYDLPVRVRGVRQDGTVVVEGEIRLRVSARR